MLEMIAEALDLVQADERKLFSTFQPSTIPVLIYDGQRTWLFGCEPQEDGWHAEGRGFYWPGRYPALVGHTAVKLSWGEVAAGVCGLEEFVTARHLASVVAHEAFHVWQDQQVGNVFEVDELQAIRYPLQDPEVLHFRAEESEALRQALNAGLPQEEFLAQAAFWRQQRYRLLTPAQRQFERKMELREGLAHYIETRFMGTFPSLDGLGSLKQAARAWAYLSGAALGHLLDRSVPDWPEAVLQGQSFDELLYPEVGGAVPEWPIHWAFREAAAQQVEWRQTELAAALATFEGQTGVTVRVRLNAAPKAFQFDPMNLLPLPDGSLLHQRFLEVSDLDYRLHSLGHPARAWGPELFRPEGVEWRGLPSPTIHAGRWQVEGEGWQLGCPASCARQTGPGEWELAL